tara:strand:- start:372 stop:896 length:525 start_codon:yes stop_codon:yes gene_type:complete
MAKAKFNHARRITDTQDVNIKAVYPGTLISFNYSGAKVYDKKPLVLVLWNDYSNYKVHGINLNYLSEFKIKKLMKKLIKEDNTFAVQDQQGDYDDELPYRNMIRDPYLRLQLPTYKQNRGGNPLSKAEAVAQMDHLYESVLKKIVTKSDIYRTYIKSKMRTPKVVTYDIRGLVG